MIKKILKILLYGALIFGLYLAYIFYNQYRDKLERDAYEKNIVDTSSPTVSVLRDSILVDYRNEKKTIHIYVPPGYAKDTTTRYPVFYMLDGESSFNDMENMAPEWEIDEVINAADSLGQQTAIVIGINQAEDRDAEYTPFVNDDNPNAHGGKFAEWVATDLKAWVDTHYRTNPSPAATTIGGISRSGMMAYYFLMAHPDVFGNALVQSPSMWVDHDRLLGMELTDEQLKDKKVFVSVGEHEGGIMIPHAKDVYQKFKEKGMGDDRVTLEIIPDEGHWHPTWRKSFALAYPWVMK
ncbi:MAG: alpha/beta hydrolase-fold protein [Saprospiraceae bacterium]|nr:alpha/beta hydrolase-fold protein [Saprospiraceae bacterium]